MQPERGSGDVGRRVRRGVGCGCSVLGLVFGLVFLAVGLLAFSSMRPYDGGLIAVGTVVDVETRGSGGDRSFYPVVAFVPVGGEEAVLVSGSIGSDDPPEIGTAVEVSYLPEDPSAGRVITTGSQWFPRVFMGIGGIAVLLVLVGFVRSIAGSRTRTDDISPSESMERPPKTRMHSEPATTAESRPNTPVPSVRSNPSSDQATPTASEGRSTSKPSTSRPERSSSDFDAGKPREGWYPDPDDPNWLRWWDGSSWTDDLREA